MSDLRSIAEWIAANVDRLEAHAKRRHEQLTELEIRSRELARAVLSSLDVPADVRAAMERLRRVHADVESLTTIYESMTSGIRTSRITQARELLLDDYETVASHFLANPIRLDVPDREQLLADAANILDGPWILVEQYPLKISFRNGVAQSAERLAAHTRRTLEK